ncbi:MAG TPA: SBBP repeat-containing protein, partial [Candidatus Binataceae bacterium]|nr:SBBP repeat-containing protein [Candidatus Binataceae bacterium]
MNIARSATIVGALAGSLVVVGSMAANAGIPSSARTKVSSDVSVKAPAHPSAAAVNATAHAKVAANLSNLPLSFERNDGQTNGQVKFLSRGSGYTLFLTPSGAVLTLSKPTDENHHAAHQKNVDKKANREKVKGAAVRVSLIGADRSAKIEGQDEQTAKANYFIGNDPKKWHRNIPLYSRVKYAGVYPGIDLAYHGSNQEQLEYDFVVAPGADAGKIQLSFAGAKELTLNSGGDLVVHLADGDLVEHAPVVYQQVGGKQHAVAGKYEIFKGNHVGFTVAEYDRSKPLTIDPVLAYSTYLGGSNYDYGAAIAVNAAGNAYITGHTTSANFPVTVGAFETVEPDGRDAFVSELNPTGTALVYSTYLGGSDDATEGRGIAIDSKGDAFVTGATCADNFPTTLGSFQPTQQSCWDAFFAELDPAGASLLYSTYLGGADDDDYGYAIALDSADNAYITGKTCSDDFPTTPGAFQAVQQTCYDAFVSKLNPGGNGAADLIYSTYLGGNSDDRGNGIAVDGGGDAYVTGETCSSNFPTTAGVFQQVQQSCDDAFVTKLNPSGTKLVYSTYLGGTDDDDSGNAIAIDSAGNAYIAGKTDSDDFPVTPGAFETEDFFDCESAFMTELNSGATAETYSTYLTAIGGCEQGGEAITLDPAGDVYVAGYSDNLFYFIEGQDPFYQFPVTDNSFCSDPGLANDDEFPMPCCTGYQTGTCPLAVQTVPGGGGDNPDAFLTEFTVGPPASIPPLNVSFSTLLGGGVYDKARGVALDPSGSAYIAGDTASSDFPTTAASFQNFLAGNQNAFVSKLGCLPKGTATLFVGNYGSNGECTGAATPYACCTRAGDGTCNNGTVEVFPTQSSNCNVSPSSVIEGQLNNQCTAAGAPYSCCTGNGTGTCVDNTML